MTYHDPPHLDSGRPPEDGCVLGCGVCRAGGLLRPGGEELRARRGRGGGGELLVLRGPRPQGGDSGGGETDGQGRGRVISMRM